MNILATGEKIQVVAKTEDIINCLLYTSDAADDAPRV